MERYFTLKDKIEKINGVQGVIFRILWNNAQYILALSNFNVFSTIKDLIPVEDWRTDFLGKQGIVCISFPINEEELNEELEKIPFP